MSSAAGAGQERTVGYKEAAGREKLHPEVTWAGDCGDVDWANAISKLIRRAGGAQERADFTERALTLLG